MRIRIPNTTLVFFAGKEAAEGGQEDGGSRVGERKREGGVREDCPLPGPRGGRQGLQPPPQVTFSSSFLIRSHRRSKELLKISSIRYFYTFLMQ
jgi:hypothetical protein